MTPARRRNDRYQRFIVPRPLNAIFIDWLGKITKISLYVNRKKYILLPSLAISYLIFYSIIIVG